MKYTVYALTLLFGGLIFSTSANAGCIKRGAPISGQLQKVETRHLSGRPIISFHLYLGDPNCIKTTERNGHRGIIYSVRRVQIILEDQERRHLDDLLGSTVTAKGSMRRPSNIWHTGDAVLHKAEIVSVRNHPMRSDTRRRRDGRDGKWSYLKRWPYFEDKKHPKKRKKKRYREQDPYYEENYRPEKRYHPDKPFHSGRRSLYEDNYDPEEKKYTGRWSAPEERYYPEKRYRSDENYPPERDYEPEERRPFWGPPSLKDSDALGPPSDDEIITFINDTYLHEKRLPKRRIKELYHPHVHYHGKKHVSVDHVIRDKLRHYKKWPVRRFKLIADTVRIHPVPGIKGAYDVSFDYKFYVNGGRKTRKGRGRAELTLDVASVPMRIRRENIRVVRHW